MNELAPDTAPKEASDIPSGNWVDRWLPGFARPYARLARFDRPIGTWLVLLPCWWSIALAGSGWPDWTLIALCTAGAVVMRGAAKGKFSLFLRFARLCSAQRTCSRISELCPPRPSWRI